MGLLLYLISYAIELPIYTINFFTVLWVHRSKPSFLKTINNYFLQGAVARDKFANYNFRTGLNFWLTKRIEICWGYNDGRYYYKEPYAFGNPKETISKVLGHNQVHGTLTIFGWFWVYLLWIIDVKYWFKGGHCINSI
jgi:hypothetical protein